MKIRIEKGDKFLCIKTVLMTDWEDHEGDGTQTEAYTKGKKYLSEIDGCITDNEKDKNHGWYAEGDNYFFTDYFKQVKQ